jgi:hypothetical protein
MAALSRYRRDLTSIFINIKEFVNSIQNAQISPVERDPTGVLVIRTQNAK